MEPLDDDARPRNRHIYLLPNLLTTCGLFSGFYAILAAASGHFEHACIAVFVAGDKKTSYQQVYDVMTLLQSAGVEKMSLMSKPPEAQAR